jgi:hypothetical protein
MVVSQDSTNEQKKSRMMPDFASCAVFDESETGITEFGSLMMEDGINENFLRYQEQPACNKKTGMVRMPAAVIFA